MTELPQATFFTQVKDAIKNEPVVLVEVTPENNQRLALTLDDLFRRGEQEDGMLPFDSEPKRLWVFGAKEARLSNPDDALGFVSVYESEQSHIDLINTWVPNRAKGPYTKETILELSSFAKDYPQTADLEQSAAKLALAKVFYLDAKRYNYPQAVSVWVTHNKENMLDPFDAEQMTKLGGRALGFAKYDAKESVDSTCFLIPKQVFLNLLTKNTPSKPPLV